MENSICLSFRYGILYVLQVREGSELIERLCGNSLSNKMQIFPETTIILSFRSDSSVARSGFRAVWNIGKLRSVPRLYNFYMLNATEHEISTSHKN